MEHHQMKRRGTRDSSAGYLDLVPATDQLCDGFVAAWR
jgi:hypothetical protein